MPAIGAQVGLPTYESATNFVLFECGTVARAVSLVTEMLNLGCFIPQTRNRPLSQAVFGITVGTSSQRVLLGQLLGQALALSDESTDVL